MPRLKHLKPTRNISVRIPEELAERLEQNAAQYHLTLSQEIRLAIVKHLKSAEARA